MVDFVKANGSAFVAHRLRRSSDEIVDQMAEILIGLGLDVPPRGASMLLLIDDDDAIGVVEIARRLRLSHPLIVRMAKRFEALRLVTIKPDPVDARRRILVPTAKARREAAIVRVLNARVNVMFDSLFAEINCSLIAVLDQFDTALSTSPISERLSMQSIP